MVLAIAFESVVKLLSLPARRRLSSPTACSTASATSSPGPRRCRAGRLLDDRRRRLGLCRLVPADVLSGRPSWCCRASSRSRVIENVDERHICGRATWLLPLYLLAINFFVLPIAIAGVAALPRRRRSAGADCCRPRPAGLAGAARLPGRTVGCHRHDHRRDRGAQHDDLQRPRHARPAALAAAGLGQQAGPAGLVLRSGAPASCALLLLRLPLLPLVRRRYALVSIGLISFCGVAQIAPSIVAGLYWQRGQPHRRHARAARRLRCLALHADPADAGRSRPDRPRLRARGPCGLAAVEPQALFGLEGLHPVSHALLWSLGRQYYGLDPARGLLAGRDELERLQAMQFVEVDAAAAARPALARRGQGGGAARPAGPVPRRRAGRSAWSRGRPAARGTALAPMIAADATLVQLAERQLARAIGAASARVMVASVVHGEVIGPRRRHGDHRRGLADHRVQPAPRAEVARARGGDSRAAPRQRAPAPARPAEGRLHRHRQPRAAHTR